MPSILISQYVFHVIPKYTLRASSDNNKN